MKKRKLLKILACFSMVLSLFVPVKVSANESLDYVSKSDSKIITSQSSKIGGQLTFDERWDFTDFSIVRNNDETEFEFDMTSKTEVLDIEFISLEYVDSESKIKNYYLNDVVYNSETKKYESTDYSWFEKNGTYHLNSITVSCGNMDVTSKQFAQDETQFDYVVDNIKVYEAPIIKKLNGSKDHDPNKPLTGDEMILKLDLELEMASNEGTPEISLCYKNIMTGDLEYISAVYDEEFKQYIIVIPNEFKLRGDKFEFIYAETFTIGDVYPFECENRYFTHLTKEQLDTYLLSSQYVQYEMKGMTNLDFTLNYIEDIQAPSIVDDTLKYQTTTIAQPTIIKLQMQVTDNAQSNVQGAKLVYQFNNHIEYVDAVRNVTGPSIKDNETLTFEIPVSRYVEIENYKVIGILLYDNAMNGQLYYMDGHIANGVNDDYGFTSDGTTTKLSYLSNVHEYPFEYVTYPSEAKILSNTLDDLTFEKYQEYSAVIDAPKDPESIEFLNIIKGLEEGTADKNAVYLINIAQDTSLISKKVFEAIKDKNITLIFDHVDFKDVDIFEDEGVQWVIRGQDVNQLEQMTKDVIDLAVEFEFVNTKLTGEDIRTPEYDYNARKIVANKAFLEELKSLEGTEYYVEYLQQFDLAKYNFDELYLDEFLKYYESRIKFADNGILPGKMTIRYNSDYTFARLGGIGANVPLTLYCYYVNPETGEYEPVQEDLKVLEDNCYEFNIYHNSTYVLSTVNLFKKDDTEIPPVGPGEITPPVGPDEGENGNNGDGGSTIIPDPKPIVPEKPEIGDKVDTSDKSSAALFASFASIAFIGAAIMMVTKKRENLFNK